MLSVDMIEQADSGHPGMPMGAAPMAYVLWTRLLRCNPKNPDWPDRDRFVLSAGHGSALLYSLLHLSGYDLSLAELKGFRQWGSLTPGHPERIETPGVEVTTGPLGQGFANGVGIAIAERYLAARFNRPGFEVVNHHTYGICSDGDLMEGIASEAASLAGHLGLGKLIFLYDNNHISLAAETRITFTEDVGRRFEAYDWQVLEVEDGNDLAAIDRALCQARKESARPSLIMVRTHIGYGSPHKQDSFESHGSPLGTQEVRATKENLGWPHDPPFLLPPEVLDHFRQAVNRGERLESDWSAMMHAYAESYPDLREKWGGAIRGELPPGWDEKVPRYAADHKPIATRSAGGDVINAIAPKVFNLIGGSADLDPSTKTAIKGRGTFQFPGSAGGVLGAEPGEWSYAGANIAFGVREHAMGGILNGMAAHGGVIPYGSTFLIFSDYLKPALRLAALSRLAVKYVFTHDSIALGEDGPTHQPIEQLAGFRAIPNLTVIRPADANEVVEAWKVAMGINDGPVILVMTRQNLPVLDRKRFAPANGLRRGAYILADAPLGNPELILIATGSELHPALDAWEQLTDQGRQVRLVSMPSQELFDQQPEDYRHAVLPPGITARIAIEAAATFGWHKYVGLQGRVIGIDRFGASAPGEVNLEKFGFTAENIMDKARALLG
jgi:transketolase